MYIELIASLPFIFFISFLVGLTIYLLGQIVAAKGEKSVGKTTPYACGEELSPKKFQVNVEEFFIYAIYFLIFDILAFILATSLSTFGHFPIVYTLIILMTVLVLTPLRR